MPELLVESGPQKGQVLFLRPPGPVFVGRDLDADFALFDRAASRRHFRVDFADEGYLLTDLRSRSGTWVNDSRSRLDCLLPETASAQERLCLPSCSTRLKTTSTEKEIAGYRSSNGSAGGMGSVYRALQTSLTGGRPEGCSPRFAPATRISAGSSWRRLAPPPSSRIPTSYASTT